MHWSIWLVVWFGLACYFGPYVGEMLAELADEDEE